MLDSCLAGGWTIKDGVVATDDGVIDTFVIGDKTYAIVATGGAESGIQVIDLSDPTNPTGVASAIDGASLGSLVWGSIERNTGTWSPYSPAETAMIERAFNSGAATVDVPTCLCSFFRLLFCTNDSYVLANQLAPVKDAHGAAACDGEINMQGPGVV